MQMRLRTPERHRRFVPYKCGVGLKAVDDMSPTTSLGMSCGEGREFLFDNEPSGYSTPSIGGQNKGGKSDIHVG